MKTKYPILAAEWDYNKNKINPSEVHYKTKKEFGWICSKGHEWKSSVYNRAKRNVSCPYCRGKFLKGFNDLKTRNPEL